MFVDGVCIVVGFYLCIRDDVDLYCIGFGCCCGGIIVLGGVVVFLCVNWFCYCVYFVCVVDVWFVYIIVFFFIVNLVDINE